MKESAKRGKEKSMPTATSKLRGISATVDASISVEGTWQCKDFMSMIAFITAIFVDSVKPLDIAFLSKCCKVYTQKQAVKKTDPQTYDKRKENHKSGLHDKDSSPAMEKAGSE